MRIAAIVLGALALVALAGGIFAYWINSALICVDVCPSVSSAARRLPGITAFTLGPGLLLSLVAWILSLATLRAGDRSTAFLITLVTPLIIMIAVTLILSIATPAAVSGPPEVAPADRQLSADWLNATRFAVIPLIVWPLVSCVAPLICAPSRKG